MIYVYIKYFPSGILVLVGFFFPHCNDVFRQQRKTKL